MAAAEPSLWPARSDSWLELGGRVALVTGGAAGIGRACAIELLRCGCAVALADKAHADKGEAEARELARTTGGRCVFVACDVSDRASIEAAVATAERELGPLHVVVANAGINIPGVLVDLGGQDEASSTPLRPHTPHWVRVTQSAHLHPSPPARSATRTGTACSVSTVRAPRRSKVGLHPYFLASPRPPRSPDSARVAT